MKEIEIPEGYEARIEGNKVIMVPKESEDERIRKALLRCCDDWEKGQFGCMAKEDIPAIRAYLEKQKEQEPLSTEETELNSIAFLEQLGYTCVPPEAEPKSIECDKETDIQKAFREGQNAGRQEVFDNPGTYGLEEIDNVFGFRIGDKVRLVDGDGRPHIIKHFEKIKGLHGPDFYRVLFEDNTASDHIIPGDEYPNGYFTRIEKIDKQKKQEPVEWNEEDDMLIDELESYILYDKEFNDEQKSWRIKRLKSLRPKSHWKPRKEQLDALNWVANSINSPIIRPFRKELRFLYESLKKL